MIVHVNRAPGAAAFIEATSFVTVKHLATVALICWNCTSYIFEKKINKLKSTFFFCHIFGVMMVLVVLYPNILDCV